MSRALTEMEPTVDLRAVPTPESFPVVLHVCSYGQTCPGLTQLTCQGCSRGPTHVPACPPFTFPLHLSPLLDLPQLLAILM